MKRIREDRQRKAQSQSSKDLLAVGNEDSIADAEPIWLIISTKKVVADSKRLKPGKIAIPHSLNRAGASICLITPDPQRTFKDIITHESFPEPLKSQIRVLGMTKLKKRYKSFESLRQLHAEYDVFLADDRVVTMLPRVLGKTFYEGPKRPLPIDIRAKHARKERQKPRAKSEAPSASSVATPKILAKEVEKAISCARINLSPSITTSVIVGYSHFEPAQLQENTFAIVNGMVDKFIPKGWRNMKSVHIKGPTSIALPIWQTSQLWVDEADVLEDHEAEQAKALNSQKGRKRKHKDGEEQTTGPVRKRKMLGDEAGFTKEMAERREALRKQKRSAIKEAEQGLDPKVEVKVVSAVG